MAAPAISQLTELSPAVQRVGSSVIRDLLAITERPDVISLAGGKPAPESFPVDAIRDATDAVLARHGAAALQYSATEGYLPLRSWLAEQHGVTVDQVTVTAGSQQGLDLVARALVRADDVVVMADPGYIGAIQAFRLAGARLVGLPSDEDGLVVAALAEALDSGLRPRAVYVVANLSNPTGTTLPDSRREQLATLAERYGFWLVEDDPYGALRWSGTAPLPLATWSDRVATLGTVSKVLCPGLRVAHLVAPAALSAGVVQIKQAADLHTATLTQRIVHELVTRPGLLADRCRSLQALYRPKANALAAALHRHLGAWALDFTEPAGGMFIWARLAGVDTTALLERALRAGVAFVPGNAFAVTRRHDDWMRLSFATANPAEIDEGIRRIAAVLSEPDRDAALLRARRG